MIVGSLIGFFFEGRYEACYFLNDSDFDGWTVGEGIVKELTTEGMLDIFIHTLRSSTSTSKKGCTVSLGFGDDKTKPLSTALKWHLFDENKYNSFKYCSDSILPSCVYKYIVDLDNMELLVRLFGTYLHRIPLLSIPCDWRYLVKTGQLELRQTLPHTKRLLDSATKAMADRGYEFVQWISQRSEESVVGEFIATSTNEAVAIKCFYGESLRKGQKYHADECCSRELQVASMLLPHASSADFPRGIVPIRAVITESAEDIRALVMNKALFNGDFVSCRRSMAHDGSEPTVPEAPFFKAMLASSVSFTEVAMQLLEHMKTAILDLWSGLRWLHERDFLFIDVKPSNVLVTGEGEWLLCDLETVSKCSNTAASKLLKAAAARHEVESSSSSSGESFRDHKSSLVADIKAAASEGSARWEQGWRPLKYARKYLDFGASSGYRTVQQDYCGFAELLLTSVFVFYRQCCTRAADHFAEDVPSSRELFSNTTEKSLKGFKDLVFDEDGDMLLLEEVEELLTREVIGSIDTTLRYFQIITD